MRKSNNIKKPLVLAFLSVFAVSVFVAFYTMTPPVEPAEELAVGGGPGTINQLSPFTVTGGYVKVASSTAGFQVPSLANCDTIDTDGDGKFECGTDGGGAGGSATTTINGVSGPTFSFATGTATGIGLTIATSSGTLTFTPTVSSGYVIPLSASTTEWATAYGWGDHSLAGYLTGVAWGDITGTLSNQTDLQTALNAKQDTLTTGNLTESITGLEFDATRSVIGGAAALSLTSGYVIPLTASTTEWSTAYASTTALTPAYMRGLFSNTATGLTYNSSTGETSLTANYIIPLSASTTNWNTFYDTPSNRITAGTNLTWSGNTLNVDDPFAVTNASSTNLTISGNTYLSGLTSALVSAGANGILSEYAGTACTNQFVRSLSVLGAATCAAVSLTADVSGVLPIANGGTGTSTAPALGQVLLGNASGTYDLVATSSLGISGGSATPGGSDTQIQYNNGSAFGGTSGFTWNDSNNTLTMTGTTTLATTTVSTLAVSGASTFTGTATFGGDIIGPGFCDTTAANCLILNSTSATLNVGAGDYFQFNSSENNADAYFSTDNATYTLFVDGGTDRVGIGTSTPSSLLTVAGTSTLETATIIRLGIGTTTVPTGTTRLTVDGSALFTGETNLGSNLYVNENIGLLTNGGTLFWGDESTYISGNSSTDIFSVWTNSAESLTLNSSGYLGLGTTTPQNNLHIANTADSAILLEADTDNTTESDNPFIKMTQDGGAVIGLIGVVGDAGRDPEHVLYTDTLGNSILIGGQTTFEAIQFGTNDAVRMTVANGGNVGIATTSPSHRLTVNGDVLARSFTSTSTSATSTLAGALNVGTTTNRAMLHVMGQSGGNLISLVTSSGVKALEMTNAGVATLLNIWDFTNAVLRLPFGTNPTVDDNAEIAVDTTSVFGQVKIDTGTSTMALVPDFDKSWPIASTSPDYLSKTLSTGTTTWKVWNATRPITINSIYCEADVGTALVRVGDGTNWTEGVACSTSPTADTSLSNNTFTAREDFIIEIGSGATSPNWITPTFNFQYTLE